MKISLKNAFVYTENGFKKDSFSIDNNKIVPFCDSEDFSVYDCDGLYIFPGFVDVHVHLREPGFSYKETVVSGTDAAVRSGYTALCTMPNLNPVPDSLENLNLQLELIKKGAKCKVVPFGSITVGEKGETLSAMEDMAEFVIGYSDDGRGVQSEAMMRTAMEKAKKLSKIISAHCEDNSLLNGGVIHDGEFARSNNIPGICSESEYGPIARDVELVREIGVSYHVCHISTKESVDIIRKAKKDGVNITCETGPHYLVLNDMQIKDEGRFKMNPPIRSEEDRIALVEGLADGTIDMIATDHAPHSAEEKSKGLLGSAMGVVGLETAFPVLYTELVKKGIITLEKLVEVMSTNPRKRFFPDDTNVDLCVYDLSQSYTVNPENFATMGRSTPFEGREVLGKCVLTVCNGEIKYDAIK
ncbi:MAG: dihydroorotase [Ruminococcaceae bacterium]|nr:dihydroorotase [Oscillospiraceae bacterium]